MTRPLLLLAALLATSGCTDQSMREQKKYRTYSASDLFADGAAARPLPPGTISQSDPQRLAEAKAPPPVTQAVIERGRQRFDIFCSPCHGRAGKGDGMIVQRGFPKPPSYHTDRLRAAPAQHFFDVITQGYGVMYPYAARVAPADRWAIVAYIRALQLSEDTKLARAPNAPGNPP